MNRNRLWIAAAILAAAIYWKYSLPAFRNEALPALRSVLAAQQLGVSERTAAWLGRD